MIKDVFSLDLPSLAGGSHSCSEQPICHCKLGSDHPETLARWTIENLHRDARSQQVSRKLASKNAEFREWRNARSTGRNEKPRTDWRLAGSCVQSETGFASVTGGQNLLRTLDTVLIQAKYFLLTINMLRNAKNCHLVRNPPGVQKLLRKRAEKVGADHRPWSTGFVICRSSRQPDSRQVCNPRSLHQGFEPKVQHWQLCDTDLTTMMLVD